MPRKRPLAFTAEVVPDPAEAPPLDEDSPEFQARIQRWLHLAQEFLTVTNDEPDSEPDPRDSKKSAA